MAHAASRPAAPAAVRGALADPHVVLAVSGAAVLAADYGYQQRVSVAWLVLQAALAAAGLAFAWRRQEQLRLRPLLLLAAGLQLGFVLMHLALGLPGDPDSRNGGVFDRQARSLLDGDYPGSEYPLGAVLLFTLERAVSGGETRAANALVMVPFQLLVVGGIWAVRTRLAPWLAALVAFLPLNAFYWEYRYDLAPAGLLVLGLVLALRARWLPAAVVLAAGAVVKWTPGLSALVLVAWLVGSGRRRTAGAFAAVFGLVIVLVHLPFLLWEPDDVSAAYTRQGGRAITPESIWYLPLRAFGLARVRTHISFAAGAPDWADVAATVVQALLLLALVVLAFRLRSPGVVVALAALAPGVFLLTNRIFSPQFILVILAGWALAAALVLRTHREQLLFGALVEIVVGANAFVYPYAFPYYSVTWQICAATMFACALVVTGWLVVRALSGADAPRTAPRSP